MGSFHSNRLFSYKYSYLQVYLVLELKCLAKISIFTDKYLTHITDDHFEIKLVAPLMDQIYVVPSPLRYDDTPLDPMTFTQSVNSTGSPIVSAPMMPLNILIK